MYVLSFISHVQPQIETNHLGMPPDGILRPKIGSVYARKASDFGPDLVM